MIAVCAVTILVGFSQPMTKEDNAALKTATKNCSKYYPDAPCLKELRKKEELVYHAICGKAKDPKSWDSYKSYSPDDLHIEYTVDVDTK